MSFTVVAILKPKQGKTDRVMELLEGVMSYVKENEPGVLRYQAYRDSKAAKDGTEDIVMIETYKDKASFQAHGSSKEFNAFQKKLADEGLMRDKMLLKILNEKMGFSSRL